MPKCSRIIILGARNVGKSAVIEQLVHGHHTIGARLYPTMEDIYEVVIENERGIKEKVRIFDTAGLESNNFELSKHYLNIADGFILVYSITSKSSLNIIENAKKQIEKLRGKECPLIVLGTKTDLLEQRECDYKAALKWSENEKVKLYEICVGDRRALREPLIWLVSRLSTQTGGRVSIPGSHNGNLLGIDKAVLNKLSSIGGKGYLHPGHSDGKRFLSKKKPSNKNLVKDTSVSD